MKRREFLSKTGAAGSGLILAQVGQQSTFAQELSTEPSNPTPTKVPDSTKVPGANVSKLGERSPFESIERLPLFNVISGTPLHKLSGTITPSDLHFERHHAGIPSIDPNDHELLLHGMVDRPLKFTMNELKRFPSITRTCFIECSGNFYAGATPETSVQMLCGLTSQSEWTGVALSTLLREAGVQNKATWLLAEGSDAAVMTRSIPMSKALDDALVVYAQNGEPLRPAQGYPIRLLLPGWEGNTNIKWLRRIEVSDSPFMTREETAKYTDALPNGTARQFSVVMDTRSVITSPTFPAQIQPGWNEISGIAWSGRGRIAKVEVSTDDGVSWRTAELKGQVLPKAHTRFGCMWNWNGKPTVIMSRAIDESGNAQPTLATLLKSRGTPSLEAYHFNPIQAWSVDADGQMRFRPEM